MYPKSFVKEVLDYLDAGHFAREAKSRFGVSSESAALRQYVIQLESPRSLTHDLIAFAPTIRLPMHNTLAYDILRSSLGFQIHFSNILTDDAD